MNVDLLVSMANDIAAFFDSEPDKAVAAEGVRFHIARYWDPRMRREIIAHVQAGGVGMCATALGAVKALALPPNSSNQ
ncbi:MAG: formate dehydrogenase subunit delta [Pseudomonadota bacterium]